MNYKNIFGLICLTALILIILWVVFEIIETVFGKNAMAAAWLIVMLSLFPIGLGVAMFSGRDKD